MPFNSDNAADCGRKGGKWTKPPDNVRNKQLRLAVTANELNAIDEKAKALKLSRTELIIRAVAAYDET